MELHTCESELQAKVDEARDVGSDVAGQGTDDQVRLGTHSADGDSLSDQRLGEGVVGVTLASCSFNLETK